MSIAYRTNRKCIKHYRQNRLPRMDFLSSEYNASVWMICTVVVCLIVIFWWIVRGQFWFGTRCLGWIPPHEGCFAGGSRKAQAKYAAFCFPGNPLLIVKRWFAHGDRSKLFGDLDESYADSHPPSCGCACISICPALWIRYCCLDIIDEAYQRQFEDNRDCDDEGSSLNTSATHYSSTSSLPSIQLAQFSLDDDDEMHFVVQMQLSKRKDVDASSPGDLAPVASKTQSQ